MADNQRPSSSLFTTHIDVSTHTASDPKSQQGVVNVVEVLERLAQSQEQMVLAQEKQNDLLEEMLEQMSAAQRQRSSELAQWKQANPRLARRCREAAETLGKVQSVFLEVLSEEITDNAEHMMDGDFVMNEFVDRFGPRLAHLNGVLQVLSQLSATGVDH